MITVNATLSSPIRIGHRGENTAMAVKFDLTEFQAEFPGGTAELLVQRPDESSIYPVTLNIDGASAAWVVTSADTEKHELGRCELQWRVGETLAKSNVYVTAISPALDASSEPPDPPSKRWFDSILAQIGDLSDLTTLAKSNLVAAINEAARTGSGGTAFDIGPTLRLDGNTLSVNTTDAAEQDNTLPITSAGVYKEVGNINALLATI